MSSLRELSGIPDTGMDTGIQAPAGIPVSRPHTGIVLWQINWTLCSRFRVRNFVKFCITGASGPGSFFLFADHFAAAVSPPNLASAPILQSFCELRQTTFILCLNH